MHLFEILSSVVTIVWFLAFIGLCVWAWSGRRRKDFDAAARLALDDADVVAHERKGGR
jgi:cytochrome c oxidase cbb3-type subunit IV